MRVLAYPHNFIIIITKMYIHIFFPFHDVNIKKEFTPLTHNKKAGTTSLLAHAIKLVVLAVVVYGNYLARLGIYLDFNVDVTVLVGQGPYGCFPVTI